MFIHAVSPYPPAPTSARIGELLRTSAADAKAGSTNKFGDEQLKVSEYEHSLPLRTNAAASKHAHSKSMTCGRAVIYDLVLSAGGPGH